MKVTKRQLRRIIREAIDPRELEEPLGGWAGDALHNDPNYRHHTDTDHFKVGDLVRSVDYEGDGWGGDYERSVGDQVGTVIEITPDPDGTQYTVYFPDGTTVMDTPSEFEIVKEAVLREGNSTDPRGLKTLLVSLNVKGRDFRPVANALSTAYHDAEGAPQDMKDEVEIHSGGLSTSTDGEWIDWPIETYQEIWNLYKKAEQSYRSPQASGPRW
jgi:hypothetical protein